MKRFGAYKGIYGLKSTTNTNNLPNEEENAYIIEQEYNKFIEIHNEIAKEIETSKKQDKCEQDENR